VFCITCFVELWHGSTYYIKGLCTRYKMIRNHGVDQVFIFKFCDFLKLFSMKRIGSKYFCKHGQFWRDPLIFSIAKCARVFLFLILCVILDITAIYGVICQVLKLGSLATLRFCHYSSNQVKTESIWPCSACLAFLKRFGAFWQVIWHFYSIWIWHPWFCV